MIRSTHILTAALLAIGSNAFAGAINITPVGGGITLNSGDLTSTVFGSVKPAWAPGSLASVHNALNAAGIDTEGKVTFVPADTNHGLALLVLIDREVAPPPPASTGHLQMASSGAGQGLTYINNVASTVMLTTGADGSRVASANFVWNANGGGDAFAWANLHEDDTVSFRFLRPSSGTGLIEPSTFQFVTWGSNGWELAAVPAGDSLFDSDGSYSFGGRVVPLPSAFAMGTLSLLAASAVRRRARA